MANEQADEVTSPASERTTQPAAPPAERRTPRRRASLLIDDLPTDRGSKLRRLGLRLVSIAIFFVAWWVVTRFELIDPKFIPKPGLVWDRFQQSIHTETKGTADFPIVKDGIQNYFLWQHWWASMQRLLWGLLWSVVIGVPFGLLLSTVRWFRLLFEPYLDFLRALPPLAYFSLLILWFGIGDTSKIWLLFLAGLAPIALSIVSGTRGIPRDRVLAAQALGASRLQTIRHLVLPSVLPDFFNGLRLAVGFILTTIVAAETTAGLPGIGGLAWVSKKTGNGDTVILCIFVIGATALVLDGLVKALDRKLVPWRGRG
ncbi:ABC transporter permease [Aquihabitans sp. G128]|uniref:ABC transporter permease n=1 Tax=Aquihabitans sp. G128 TaxID=2849779 RepID=UPI001C23767E|nr:ABC transporter permease [Aquihabitans sp. G128]QXC59388.1 ABC transporter permease [Aquihabitans sp. G128]